ncbi:hypothetical protein NST86_33105 [Bacillus sp. FSL L8-0199]|uniref:hypothetical protein n=1 Tax=Bacillus sp. FSL L8-0199 TaxID=2954616 RepID=UPI0030FB0A09
MKSKEKSAYYGIEDYSKEQLFVVQQHLFQFAEAIGGLPKNHLEVFHKRGWLLPFLYAYDDLLWGRWNYWFEILEKETIEGSGPIPQIEWVMPGNSGFEFTKKMLMKCVDHYDSRIDSFAHWLHWGLALTDEPLNISEKLNQHYYENFDMFLMQKYPSDYMSHVLCEQTGKGYKDGLGYFPTPYQVSIMMTQIAYTDADNPIMAEKYKKQTINDPCVGCGSTFLPASNYSLRGAACDVSKIAIDLVKIQSRIYAPWFSMHPEHIKGFDKEDIFELRPSEEKKSMEGQLQLVF